MKRKIQKELNNLLEWFEEFYKSKQQERGGGAPPKRRIQIIEFIFSKLDAAKFKYTFNIKYEDIYNYYQKCEKEETGKDLAPYVYYIQQEIKDRVRIVKSRLRDYYNSDVSAESVYVIDEFIIPHRGGAFHVSFKKRTEFEIEVSRIKKEIKKNNIDEFSHVQYSYIHQSIVRVKDSEDIEWFLKRKVDKKQQKTIEVDDVSRFTTEPVEIMKMMDSRSINRLLMYGDAGIGKSSALQNMTCVLSSKKTGEVPLYIDLRKERPLLALCSHIPDDIRIKKDNLEEYCIQVFASGGLLILIDSYNDITINKDKTEEEISQLLNSKTYQSNSLIIATRKDIYPNILVNHDTCQIFDFSDSERLAYISKREIEDPESFIGELRKSKLDSISRIPIFLKYICDFKQETGKVEETVGTRGQLLKNMVEKHFKYYEEKTRKASGFLITKEDLIDRITPLIAYNAYKELFDRRYERSDFSSFILSNELKELKDLYGSDYKPYVILKTLTKHNILEEYEYDEISGPIYIFSHQLLQDYFAAIELKRRLIQKTITIGEKTEDDLINEIVANTKFFDTILILINLIEVEEARKIIKEIKKYNIFLAGYCLMEYKGKDDIFDEVINELLEHQTTVAIRILKEIGTPLSVKKYIEKLKKAIKENKFTNFIFTLNMITMILRKNNLSLSDIYEDKKESRKVINSAINFYKRITRVHEKNGEGFPMPKEFQEKITRAIKKAYTSDNNKALKKLVGYLISYKESPENKLKYMKYKKHIYDLNDKDDVFILDHSINNFIAEYKKHDVRKTIFELSKDPQPDNRISSTRPLAWMKDDKALQLLMKLSQDSEENVRKAAILAINFRCRVGIITSEQMSDAYLEISSLGKMSNMEINDLGYLLVSHLFSENYYRDSAFK